MKDSKGRQFIVVINMPYFGHLNNGYKMDKSDIYPF